MSEWGRCETCGSLLSPADMKGGCSRCLFDLGLEAVEDGFPDGARIGSYEIRGRLGAGGCGVVYRAWDSNLKREVALKTFPLQFSEDVERTRRFEREAETLASLNHPNVAAIHHRDRVGDWSFLVLELVDGESLAERLKRGPIPVDQALVIAKQIAHALESAHAKGIVHRDVKPGNVMLTPARTVKILDFGLAKSLGGGDAESDATIPLTSIGLILGTVPYMSPEQASGKEIDRTTDIWAFGCVLYEMLTGRATFEGETQSEVMANILKSEPEWTLLPPETPPAIRRLLRRCLRKEQTSRLHDMTDARLEIEEADTEPLTSFGAPPAGPRISRREWLAWTSAGLLGATAAASWMRNSRAPEPLTSVLQGLPTGDPVSLAISPDGKEIAFVASSLEGRPTLWLANTDGTGKAQALRETVGARLPFWRPQGDWLGYFANGQLWKIRPDGTQRESLAPALSGRGASWNRFETILFAPRPVGLIFSVRETGGEEPKVATSRMGHEIGHYFPQFLPDNVHFLCYAPGIGVCLGNLGTPGAPAAPHRVLDAEAAAVYHEQSAQLLFVRQGKLLRQRFTYFAGSGSVSGEEKGVVPEVAVHAYTAAVSGSVDGTVVYRKGDGCAPRQLRFYDAKGVPRPRPIAFGPGCSLNLSVGRQQKLVAVERNTEDAKSQIWLARTDGGNAQPATDGLSDVSPVVDSNTGSVLFARPNPKTGVYDLWAYSENANPSESLWFSTPEHKGATDISEHYLLYNRLDPREPGASVGIWRAPLQDGRPVVGKEDPVVAGHYDALDAQFCPGDDGLIAYQSYRNGGPEIFIKRIGGAERYVDKGAQARWGADGRLLYIGADDRLMATKIKDPGEPSIEEPQELTRTRIGSSQQLAPGQQYAVLDDGGFLMNEVVEISSPIEILRGLKS